MSDFYRITHRGNIRILTISNLLGEHANRQIIDAAQQLMEDGHPTFIIDLSEMTVMNSVGLNFLITMRARSSDRGGRLVVCGAPPRILQLFEITKLRPLFDLADNVDDGLSRLQQSQ